MSLTCKRTRTVTKGNGTEREEAFTYAHFGVRGPTSSDGTKT